MIQVFGIYQIGVLTLIYLTAIYFYKELIKSELLLFIGNGFCSGMHRERPICLRGGHDRKGVVLPFREFYESMGNSIGWASLVSFTGS